MKKRAFYSIFMIIFIVGLASCKGWIEPRPDRELFGDYEPLEWKDSYIFAATNYYPPQVQVWDTADEWLLSLGYRREGLYYRVEDPKYHTVALFGHGGETAALLSHLFNIPFPFFCSAMGPDYTGIVVLTLPDQADGLVPIRFELVNDVKHIEGLRVENVFDN